MPHIPRVPVLAGERPEQVGEADAGGAVQVLLRPRAGVARHVILPHDAPVGLHDGVRDALVHVIVEGGGDQEEGRELEGAGGPGGGGRGPGEGGLIREVLGAPEDAEVFLEQQRGRQGAFGVKQRDVVAPACGQRVKQGRRL